MNNTAEEIIITTEKTNSQIIITIIEIEEAIIMRKVENIEIFARFRSN